MHDSDNKNLEMYISGNLKFNTLEDILDVCINICDLFKSKDVENIEKQCNMKAEYIQIDENKSCIINFLDCNTEKDDEDLNSKDKEHHQSLAKILFGLLFKSNPFEGRQSLNKICYSEEEEKNIQSNIFVYSKKDESNRPIYGIHGLLIKCWNKIYPDYIKDKFIDVFDNNIEVREDEWKEVLNRFKEEISPKLEKVKKIYKLKIENDKDIELKVGHNVCLTSMENEIIGKIIENKKHEGIIGLKNLSDFDWTYTNKEGKESLIEKGKVLVIQNGINIKFNENIKGQITRSEK